MRSTIGGKEKEAKTGDTKIKNCAWFWCHKFQKKPVFCNYWGENMYELISLDKFGRGKMWSKSCINGGNICYVFQPGVMRTLHDQGCDEGKRSKNLIELEK